MTDGWQHSGSFVVRFSPVTNPRGQRFYGRVEHVATGKMLRFSSMEDMVNFMNGILIEVRDKFEAADTLVEELPQPNNDKL